MTWNRLTFVETENTKEWGQLYWRLVYIQNIIIITTGWSQYNKQIKSTFITLVNTWDSTCPFLDSFCRHLQVFHVICRVVPTWDYWLRTGIDWEPCSICQTSWHYYRVSIINITVSTAESRPTGWVWSNSVTLLSMRYPVLNLWWIVLYMPGISWCLLITVSDVHLQSSVICACDAGSALTNNDFWHY